MLLKKETGWLKINEIEKKEIFEFCEGYKEFLNSSKTEREFVKNTRNLILESGFKDAKEYSEFKAGDKFYYVNREKNIVIGKVHK